MESLSSIVKDIQSSAEVVQSFLDSHSTAAASPRFPDDAPEEVLKARAKLINSAQALHAVAQGPAEYLKWQASVAQDLMPIQWLFRHDIASKVPPTGAISYEELADATHVDKRILQRVVRSAMLSARLFREPRPEYIAHSPASLLLATDPGMRGLMKFELDVLAPALARTIEAHQKWDFSTDRAHTGFNLAFEYPDKSFYEYCNEHPENRDALDRAFVEYARTYGWQPRHLLKGFDFASLPVGSKVVDIGGSRGQNSIFLARQYPGLKFVVQDMPDVVTKGKEQLPQDLQDRIEFQAYDFHTPQPIVDADVYYIQNCFADQGDDDALSTLRNAARAMQKPGAKLVIREPVLPTPGAIPLEDELRIRRFDFRAMCILNSGHRTTEEWSALIDRVGEGLKLVRVCTPENSCFSVMVSEIGQLNRTLLRTLT